MAHYPQRNVRRLGVRDATSTGTRRLGARTRSLLLITLRLPHEGPVYPMGDRIGQIGGIPHILYARGGVLWIRIPMAGATVLL